MAGTTVVLNDVGVSAGTIWRIVNLGGLLGELCMGPLRTNLSGRIEMVATLDAFSRWIRYQATIVHENIAVSARSITLIGCEFYMICTTQSQYG